MKMSAVSDLLDMAFRSRANGTLTNILLVSPPGLGKTEVCEAYAKSRGIDYLVLSLASYDPPDFQGYPVLKEENGLFTLNHALPQKWPRSGKVLINMEEVNRTKSANMQCILSMLDSRRGFDNYIMPEECVVIANVNPDNGQNEVQAMDPALLSRFDIFEIEYNKQDFIDHMKKDGWDKNIVAFVESGIWNFSLPELIKGPGSKYLSPRAFYKLNSMIKAGFNPALERDIYNAALGMNVGKDFYNFLHEVSPVFYSDLLANEVVSLTKLKKFSDPDNHQNGLLTVTIKDIVENGIDISDELLMQLVRTIPTEHSMGLIKKIENKRKTLKEDKKYELLKHLHSKFPDFKKFLKVISGE